MSTYSPVDELTLSMKWAVDEMAVKESPPHQRVTLYGAPTKSLSDTFSTVNLLAPFLKLKCTW
jgi:hypothetical protein